MRAIILIIPLTLQLAGCASEPRPSVPRVAATQAERKQLSEDEEARCRQIAWEAVNSPETLERFKPRRITHEPFKFSDKGISCYLNQDTLDTVEVAVPSGGSFSLHGCYLGVTLKRDTFEVLSMEESFWP